MRTLVAALVFVAALLAPPAARGEGRFVVTIVSPPDAGAVVREATVRLRGELEAAGFSLRIVERKADLGGHEDVEADASAVIALVETEDGAEAGVWVADHATRNTLVRRVKIGDPGDSNAASDLAVRGAELLRASLLDASGAQRRALPEAVTRWLDEAAPAATDRRAKSPPAKSTVVASTPGNPARRDIAPNAGRPRVEPLAARFEAGLGLLAGGLGVTPALLLRAAHDLPAGLTLRATCAPGLLATSRSTDAGSVSIHQTLVSLDVAYRFSGPSARFTPLLALGGGLYRVAVDGEAEAPHRGLHPALSSAAFLVAGGLGIRVIPGLTVRAELDLLLLAPAPVVAIAGVEVGRTGRPAFLPTLGLELAL